MAALLKVSHPKRLTINPYLYFSILLFFTRKFPQVISGSMIMVTRETIGNTAAFRPRVTTWAWSVPQLRFILGQTTGCPPLRCCGFLLYGQNVWPLGFQDVEQLANELPNLVDYYLVPYDKWNHLDFIWATDVYELLYKQVLKIIQQHWKEQV